MLFASGLQIDALFGAAGLREEHDAIRRMRTQFQIHMTELDRIGAKVYHPLLNPNKHNISGSACRRD